VTGYGALLKPVQLLWVNLIIGILGPALATELPTPDMLRRSPTLYDSSDFLISGRMWRNIIAQSAWQIFLCLGLRLGIGPILKFMECIPKGQSADYRDTMLYNAFFWAQLFNGINARKIFDELNPLAGILSNRMFLACFAGSTVMQFITVQFAGPVVKTVPLDGKDWAMCIVLGLISVPIGIAVRLMPPLDWLNREGRNKA
jgi:Ca2+-transporting ATPase